MQNRGGAEHAPPFQERNRVEVEASQKATTREAAPDTKARNEEPGRPAAMEGEAEAMEDIEAQSAQSPCEDTRVAKDVKRKKNVTKTHKKM